MECHWRPRSLVGNGDHGGGIVVEVAMVLDEQAEHWERTIVDRRCGWTSARKYYACDDDEEEEVEDYVCQLIAADVQFFIFPCIGVDAVHDDKLTMDFCMWLSFHRLQTYQSLMMSMVLQLCYVMIEREMSM